MDKKALEDKFNCMKLPDLKAYLQNRGITVNGYLKPGLVAIACAVEEMRLPLLCRVSESESRLELKKRLQIHDVQLSDPFKMAVSNDFKFSPPFGLFDIFNHLIYRSSEYDKQGLSAYKSYENYRLFFDGYVESLLTTYVDEAGVNVYVGKVKPAMKDKTKQGKDFYDLWFVLEGKGSNRGTVLDAYCVCLGGRDGGCKHVAAALYSLDDLLNSKGEDSVTSKPCKWIRRSKPDTTPCEIKHLSVKKVGIKDEEKKNKRNRAYTFSQCIQHDPRFPSDRVPCSQQQLSMIVKDMEAMDNKPVIFPILARQLNGLCDCGSERSNKTEKIVLKFGIMEQKVVQHLERGLDDKTFFENLQFTDEEIENVSSITKKQWQCEEWFVHKRGFVTASKAKNVYTRQISVQKNPETDVTVLVQKLTVNKAFKKKELAKEPQNPLDWGLKHEDSARKAYFLTNAHKHHQLSLHTSGFVISKSTPFLGGSPDNITKCRCQPQCDSGVVEYKCPWVHRDLDPKEAFLQKEIGGVLQDNKFALQLNSQYFYQIQVLMHVTQYKWCDLVVWTKKGIFCHRVTYSPLFMERICLKLRRFWLANVVPFIFAHVQRSGTAITKEETHVNECEQVVEPKIVKKTKLVKDIDATLNRESEMSTVNKKDAHQHVKEFAQALNKDREPSKCVNEMMVIEEIPVPYAKSTINQTFNLFGYDTHKDDIFSLRPKELITDTILSIMISDICCEYPIVDTLFYSVLVGNQDLKVQTSTRLERMQAAEKFFKAELLGKDYVFIPVNQSYHWFLAIISPWHIIILDSLTWDSDVRETVFDYISRYLEYLSQKYHKSNAKHRSFKVLKVPQQEAISNDCAVFVSLFIKYFLKDIEKYEESPSKYTDMEHEWFMKEDATKERHHWHRTLKTLFDLKKHSMQMCEN